MKILLALLAFLLFACQSDGEQLVSSWPDGSPKEIRFHEAEKLNHGFKYYQILYFENGQRQSEGLILGEHRQGLWKEWFENGQLKYEGLYIDGEKDGLHTSYMKDGVVREAINDEGLVVRQITDTLSVKRVRNRP